MFFILLLNLCSTIPSIEAVTITAKEPSELLHFRLFGSPDTLLVRTWSWKNNAPSHIFQSSAIVSLDFGYDEFVREAGSRGEKTMVFDSLDQTAKYGRPSSALTFRDQQEPTFTFNIGSISEGETHLKRLLGQFDTKMVSLWWDSTSRLYKFTLQNQVGELTIGGVNPTRFVAGTEMRLKVQVERPPLIVPYWTPVEGTAVRLGNSETNWDKKVSFDLKLTSHIPNDMYQILMRPLKAEMAYTVGLLKGMPQDINKQIMQYADTNKPVDVFDCKLASKLLPLRIGELTIKPSVMYKKITDEKCEMILQGNTAAQQQNHLKIGIDLIRQFYISVIYDSENGDTLQFAERRES